MTKFDDSVHEPEPQALRWVQIPTDTSPDRASTVYDAATAPPCPVQLARRTSHHVDPELDETLSAIIESPARPGETIALAYQRKEQALRETFATLDVTASRAMHARLTMPRPGDQLAERFSRLTAERRGRLLAFLADVRRRQALAIRTQRR